MKTSIDSLSPVDRTADTRIHVLCVDDDAHACERLESQLDRHLDRGTVSAVPSAEDAITRIEDGWTVDCIVSEYELDGTDGLTFLARVREEDAVLPFILFTAQDSVDVASEAVSAGVTDYVQKGGPDAYERLATRVTDAVAQARARRSREAARARFQALTENASFAVVTVDETGTVRYANDAVADLFGYDPDELVGNDLATLVPERLRARHTGGFDRYLDTGERTLDWEWLELSGRHRDGHEIPLGITFSEHHHDGRHLFTGILRDVTERKTHERAVEALHETTRAMMLATDRERVADLAVETTEEVLGMSVNGIWFHEPEHDRLRPVAWTAEATEVVGDPPTFSAGEANLSWEVFETGETRLFADLRDHPSRYNAATPIRSEIIVPVGDYGVMNIGATEPDAFDGSDVVLARLLAANTRTALDRIDRTETLRDRTEQLERQNEYLGRFYVLMTDPETSVDAKLQDVLALCCDHFGFDVGLLARPAGDALEVVETHAPGLPVLPGDTLDVSADAGSLVPPPDAADEGVVHTTGTTDGNGSEGGPTIQEQLGFEAYLQVPVYVSDERYGLLVFGSPTPHEQPLESTTVTLVKFVTRWLGYELARQRDRRDLERQNERLEEFASVVSHDLRNPLNAALGYVDIARTRGDTDQLDAAERALERMDALIEDTLTLARQGQMVEQPEPVALDWVIDRAWTTVTPDGDRRVEFDDATVMADPDRLQQVFENLFRNADAHAGPDVTVRVGLLSKEHGFFVADDGPGIPATDRDAVFDHGHTTSDEGTGFGLSIVKSIVEAHGWDVDVTASAAGGARFEITGVELTR